MYKVLALIIATACLAQATDINTAFETFRQRHASVANDLVERYKHAGWLVDGEQDGCIKMKKDDGVSPIRRLYTPPKLCSTSDVYFLAQTATSAYADDRSIREFILGDYTGTMGKEVTAEIITKTGTHTQANETVEINLSGFNVKPEEADFVVAYFTGLFSKGVKISRISFLELLSGTSIQLT